MDKQTLKNTTTYGANNMTLVQLQAVLGQRVRIATDESLSYVRRQQEAEISRDVASLAKQMINNADVILRVNKLVSEGKLKNEAVTDLVG